MPKRYLQHPPDLHAAFRGVRASAPALTHFYRAWNFLPLLTFVASVAPSRRATPVSSVVALAIELASARMTTATGRHPDEKW